MEEWRDIKNYEGLYQVSDQGRVKKLDHYIVDKRNGKRFYKEKILKQWKNNVGYMLVSLYKDKQLKRFLVHRLVAQAFLENTDNLPEVDHKNTITSDNQIENLLWVDRKGNMSNNITKNRINSHNKKIGKIWGAINGKTKATPIIGTNIKTGEKLEFTSIREAEATLTISHKDIWSCCNHKNNRKSAGGYTWRYK